MGNGTIFRNVSIGVLALALSAAALSFAWLLMDLRPRALAVIDRADRLFYVAHIRMEHTSRNTNAVLLQSSLVADRLRIVAEKQDLYWEKNTPRLLAVAEQGQQTLKSLELAIADQNREASLTQEHVRQLVDAARQPVDELAATFADFRRPLADLHALLNDPELKQIAGNLNQAAREGAEGVARGNESMGYIRDYLKPTKASFWKTILGLAIPKPTLRIGK